MADLDKDALVRVNGSRELANKTLPLWCNGQTGKVLRRTIDGRIIVKLDKMTAAELIFLESELELIGGTK